MSAHEMIEIKARCSDLDTVRQVLRSKAAEYRGLDNQVDTYYRVKGGRLKFRSGNIENFLIFYDRPNVSSPKTSRVLLAPTAAGNDLEQILSACLETLVIGKKKREIYFVGNVKIHLDDVEVLGRFLEIEVQSDGVSAEAESRAQCEEYMKLFGVKTEDLLTQFYSDMLSTSNS